MWGSTCSQSTLLLTQAGVSLIIYYVTRLCRIFQRSCTHAPEHRFVNAHQVLPATWRVPAAVCSFLTALLPPPLHCTAKLLAICVTGFRPFTSLGAWWCTGTETAFSTVLFSHTSHQHVAINCDVVPWSLILMSRDGNNTRLRRKRQWLQIVFNNTLNNRLRTVAPSAEQVGI